LLKKALDLRPNDIAALYQMAQLAQTKGNIAEAVALLEQVTAKQADFTPAHVLLARLYYKLDRQKDGESRTHHNPKATRRTTEETTWCH
jgi:lipopolysaccharide biosynthesis regulator YciM